MRACCYAITALALCALPLHGQGSHTYQASTVADSGIDITASPWLNARPQLGYFPILVTVINRSGSDGKWEITARIEEYTGTSNQLSQTVHVADDKIARTSLLASAGFSSAVGGASWISTNLGIQGPAIEYSNLGRLDSCEIVPALEQSFVALGTEAMTQFPWLNSAIDVATARSSDGVGGSKVIAQHTPTDWRGLSGLSSYWVTEGEWRALSGAQRSAVTDWVALGGELVIDVADAGNSTELLKQAAPNSTLAENRVAMGLGEIIALEKKDRLTEYPIRSTLLNEKNGTTLAALLNGYSNIGWKARTLVTAPTVQSGIIFLFLVIFAILAGPVNLFVFAGSMKRHRMFWTTPLLSLAGSVVLLTMILLGDGTGGTGIRLTVGVMVPELDRVVIRQEQISRSGVLLGSTFPIAEPSLMIQLGGTEEFHRRRSTNSWSLRETESTRSGDWFESRSIQGQTLQTVRATRGEIRFRADGEKPSVVSSFDVPLARVWVTDDKGNQWTAADLNPGERKGLTAISEGGASPPWDKDQQKLPSLAGPLLRDAFKSVSQKPDGFAVAEVAPEAAQKLAIASLDSIQWKQDQAYLIGPYVVDAP
jgi:hypothetical protein